jgi:DNA-binding IclR family transcriptional regulator
MSSLTRMLAVLDLFSEDDPAWTADELSERLGYSRPTTYRYVRQLCNAGLLRKGSAGLYALGTMIIELDHQIRSADPLLIAARTIVRQVTEKTGCDVTLGSIYDDRILTIHLEGGQERINASFGRGRRLPVFKGTLSKTILATLPRARLRRLYDKHAAEARDIRFAASWETLLANLKEIRAQGYCITHAELDPGLVGLSVPVVDADNGILAALGIVMSQQRFAIVDVARLVAMLHAAAQDIIDALRRDTAARRRA